MPRLLPLCPATRPQVIRGNSIITIEALERVDRSIAQG